MTHPFRLHATLLVVASIVGCSHVTTEAPAPAPRPTASAAPSKSSTAATLGIPPGHLPPRGYCRVWVPGEPPGHQARPARCEGIESQAPPGSWIVYRPTRDKKVVHVRVMDEQRPGVVVLMRVYDAINGALVSERRT